MRASLWISFGLIAAMFLQGSAFGHAERPSVFPDGSGSVPEYRTTGPLLVVCKENSLDLIEDFAEPARSQNLALWGLCQADGFAHIQAAVDAVTQPATRIQVMPGVYREEPSLEPGVGACAGLEDVALLTYAQHAECPNAHNLIGVMGDDPNDEDSRCTWERLCNLQIEGTGEEPSDVMIDVEWKKLNGIRADRADGVYIKNLLVQRTDFNSIYVIETDGAVIDGTITRWNFEYGILTFAVDHTLYKDCESYGNGDAGVYPGSASDQGGARFSVEITGCDLHHNMAGYSGTAGNSVFVHDNDMHHNAAGATMDSLFPNHPGMPQDSAVFVNNRIYSNNENYYNYMLGDDPPCFRPIEERGIEEGVVCPTAPVPVGSGIVVAGGNHNVFADNHFWDNWRFAYMLFSVPAPLREDYDPTKAFDTSHYNRFTGNQLGWDMEGNVKPNGAATWWDEGGSGNCWSDNDVATDWTSHPPSFLLPSCEETPVSRVPSAAKLGTIAPCALYGRNPDDHHPPGCWWLQDPAPPGDPNLVWFELWEPESNPFPTVKSNADRNYEFQLRSGALDANDWFREVAREGNLIMDRHELDADHMHHGPNINPVDLARFTFGVAEDDAHHA